MSGRRIILFMVVAIVGAVMGSLVTTGFQAPAKTTVDPIQIATGEDRGDSEEGRVDEKAATKKDRTGSRPDSRNGEKGTPGADPAPPPPPVPADDADATPPTEIPARDPNAEFAVDDDEGASSGDDGDGDDTDDTGSAEDTDGDD